MACYEHIRSQARQKAWWNPLRWVMNVGIALDQLGNAVTLGGPDETLSSRWGRAARRGSKFGRFNCWWLGKLDPGHCEKAIASEERRDHLPEDFHA